MRHPLKKKKNRNSFPIYNNNKKKKIHQTYFLNKQ